MWYRFNKVDEIAAVREALAIAAAALHFGGRLLADKRSRVMWRGFLGYSREPASISIAAQRYTLIDVDTLTSFCGL